MKIKLKIVLPAAIIIIAVLAIFNTISNKGTYQEARNLLESGEYVKAKEVFQTVADYKDSMDMINECDYQRAVEKMYNEEFTSAITIFTRLSGHNDADARRKEAYDLWYQKCEKMFEEGRFVRAVIQCEKLRTKASSNADKGMVFKASWLILKAEAGLI